MSSAISLKGLTTCTPEFHRIAKAAEQDGNADAHFEDLVEQLLDANCERAVSQECYEKVRKILSEAFSLGCDCE